MKNTLVLILVLVFVVVIIAFIVVSAIKRKEMTFEGTVTDKNVIETVNNMNNMNNMGNRGTGINIGGIGIGNNMNGGVTHQYMIRVKTDDGKDIKYKISEGMYETVKIGDKVSKAHGTTEITIVSSTQAAPTQPVAPAAQVSPQTTDPAAPTPQVQPTTPTSSTTPPQNNSPQSFV